MADPTLSGATLTGSNTASTSWSVGIASTGDSAVSIGDLVIVHLVSDANVTHTLPSTGPDGETITVITQSLGGTDQRISAFWYIAAAARTSGTVTVTSSASEQWTATKTHVPAGDFDAANPIGAISTLHETASVTNPTFTAFSAGAGDGGGRLVVYIGVDADAISTTMPTGWTRQSSLDRGAVADGLYFRDTLTTASESITAVNWTIGGDTYASVAYIVRPASVGGTTYTETHTFTGTGTVDISKLLVLALSQSFSGTGTSSLTQLKSFLRSFSLSGSGSLLFDRVASFYRSLTFSGVGTALLSKGQLFINSISFLGQGTPTFSRAVSSLRSFAYNGVATLEQSRIASYLRSFSFQGTATSLLSRLNTLTRSFTYSGLGTTALLRAANFLKSFTFGGSASVAFARIKVRILDLIFAGTGSASLSRISSRFRDFTYTASGTVAATKQMALSKILAYTALGSAALSKAAQRYKAFTYSGTASYVFDKVAQYGSQVFDVIVTFTGTATSNLSRQVGIFKTYAGSGSLARSITTQWVEAFNYTASAATSLSKRIGKSLNYTGSGLLSLSKSVSKVLTYVGTVTSNVTAYLRTAVTMVYQGVGSLASIQTYIPFNEPSGILKAARRVFYTLINRR